MNWIKPTQNVRVKVTPLGQGRVTVYSVDAVTDKPIDIVFTGSYRAGQRERGKRFDKWCDQRETLSATMDAMPVHF